METLSSQTKYQHLAEILRSRLQAQPNGGRLPSVRALMKRFQVSQNTVMSALRLLEEEQLISRRHGSGVYRSATNRLVVVAYCRPKTPSTDLDLKESALLNSCDQRGWKLAVQRFDPGQIDLVSEEIQADAFVLQPEIVTFHSPLLAHLLGQQVPRVVLGRDTGGAHLDFTTGDDSALLKELVKGLFDRGHRRIALLVSEPHFYEVQERIKTFREACQLLDLHDCQTLDPQIEYGQNGFEACANFLRHYLSSLSGPLPFTALISCSISGSLPAMRMLHEAGFDIPRDCSVVCMGCDPNARYFIPSLTNASPHYQELAEASLRILEQRLAGSTAPLLFDRIRYRPNWRESIGSAPDRPATPSEKTGSPC